MNRRDGAPWRLTAAEKWTIFLPALGLRLMTGTWARLRSINFGDAKAYIDTASTLLRTGRYPVHSDPWGFRAPGYPMFLLLSTLGHPGRVLWDQTCNSLLGAAAAVILGAISLRIVGSRRAAITTGIAAACHPAFLWLAAGVQSEPLFMVFLFASAFLLLVAVDRPSSGMALAAGGSLALAALTRPAALALAPFLAAPLLDRRIPPRIRVALAGSGIAGFLAFLAPWTVRNAVRYRAFLPVDDAAGVVFLQGNGPDAVSYFRLRDPGEYREWLAERGSEMRAGFPSVRGSADPNPARRSAAFMAEAMRWIRAHPREELWLLRRKIIEWLRPSPSRLAWPRPVRTVVTLEYLLLYALAAAGMANADRRGVLAFSVGILAVSMAAHVAFQVVWRYRMPFWDPILVLYASAAAAFPFRESE